MNLSATLTFLLAFSINLSAQVLNNPDFLISADSKIDQLFAARTHKLEQQQSVRHIDQGLARLGVLFPAVANVQKQNGVLTMAFEQLEDRSEFSTIKYLIFVKSKVAYLADIRYNSYSNMITATFSADTTPKQIDNFLRYFNFDGYTPEGSEVAMND